MKLLVTYDGSPASASVFRPAERLARRLGGDIVLLRIYDPRGNDERRNAAHFHELQGQWQHELDDTAARMTCRTRAEVRRLMEHSFVSDAIVDAAVGMRADLICMATRGHSGLRHLLFGSTALEMVGRSELPVMVVPGQPQIDGSRRAT